MNIEFERDESKNKVNIVKHGIDFNYIMKLFESYRIYQQDDRKDYGEVRYNTTGEIENRVYTVAYTNRNKTIRIISARKAHDKERKKYYEAKLKRLEARKN